jgi:hypothetical protein
MTLQYDSTSGLFKPQPARRARVRLNGRPHPRGSTSHQGPVWVTARRAHQASIKVVHALCKSDVKADAESIALEFINYLPELDARSLHCIRADLASYWRLSNRNR